jgi:amino acid transporter
MSNSNVSAKPSTRTSSVDPKPVADIGVVGALSIGIGGIIGGGFFATFGLGIVGARGSTYLSYLLGGMVALLTAYSYVRLTLRYREPGGTVAFVRLAFGRGLIPSSVNKLLILSYVAIMAIYALALAGYSVSYLPPASRPFWLHIVASAAIIAIGVINFAGSTLVAKFEDVFNVGKLAVLGVFITGGFLLGSPDWSRLGTANWVGTTTIVSSGIIVFLAYEGFELIANASDRIQNPQRTLPIAYYGSVVMAIVVYVLAITVAIGHMPFSAMEEAQSFALSAAAERFMGSFGFGLMTIGAVATAPRAK